MIATVSRPLLVMAHSRSTSALYAAAARRSIMRYGLRPWRMLFPIDERMVFVVGSPRSGTSFTASALGNCRGFADLGELNPLKARLGALAELPVETVAPEVRKI